MATLIVEAAGKRHSLHGVSLAEVARIFAERAAGAVSLTLGAPSGLVRIEWADVERVEVTDLDEQQSEVSA